MDRDTRFEAQGWIGRLFNKNHTSFDAAEVRKLIEGTEFTPGAPAGNALRWSFLKAAELSSIDLKTENYRRRPDENNLPVPAKLGYGSDEETVRVGKYMLRHQPGKLEVYSYDTPYGHDENGQRLLIEYNKSSREPTSVKLFQQSSHNVLGLGELRIGHWVPWKAPEADSL